jgi:hypothetical protein
MLKRTLRSLVHIQRESKSLMTCIDIDKNVYNELTIVKLKIDIFSIITIFGREKRFEIEYIMPPEKKGVIGFGSIKE